MQLLNDHHLLACLKDHGIGVTKNRMLILNILSQYKIAMSVAMIIRHSLLQLDRVTVHRALQTFLRKGIVLAVPNVQGEKKYMLAYPATTSNKKHETVSYFVCGSCGETILLANPKITQLHLPAQFSPCNFHFIIEGVCQQCTLNK